MSKYSNKEKLETVLKVAEKHVSITIAAKELGTGKEHVRRWLKRYERLGAEGLTMKKGSYSGAFKLNIIEIYA